jgi:hypothetical protein
VVSFIFLTSPACRGSAGVPGEGVSPLVCRWGWRHLRRLFALRLHGLLPGWWGWLNRLSTNPYTHNTYEIARGLRKKSTDVDILRMTGQKENPGSEPGLRQGRG